MRKKGQGTRYTASAVPIAIGISEGERHKGEGTSG